MDVAKPLQPGWEVFRRLEKSDLDEQFQIYKAHFDQFMLTDNEVAEIGNCVARTSGASYVMAKLIVNLFDGSCPIKLSEMKKLDFDNWNLAIKVLHCRHQNGGAKTLAELADVAMKFLSKNGLEEHRTVPWDPHYD